MPDEGGTPTAILVGGGIVGGAAGLVGGYLATPEAWRGSEYAPTGAIIGAVLGEALLLPLGVHLANEGRGDYRRSALISVGIAGAGLLLAVPTLGISLLAVPPIQLFQSIQAERR